MAGTEQPKNPSFRVADRWRNLYETICSRGPVSREIKYSVFDKYTQLFSVAAAIGYSMGRRNEFKSQYTPFSLNEIEHDKEWVALRSLAWQASDCAWEVLSQTTTVIRICEEYSDGGMEYLHDEFFHNHVIDGRLLKAKDIEIEKNLAFLVKGVKRHRM